MTKAFLEMPRVGVGGAIRRVPHPTAIGDDAREFKIIVRKLLEHPTQPHIAPVPQCKRELILGKGLHLPLVLERAIAPEHVAVLESVIVECASEHEDVGTRRVKLALAVVVAIPKGALVEERTVVMVESPLAMKALLSEVALVVQRPVGKPEFAAPVE